MSVPSNVYSGWILVCKVSHWRLVAHAFPFVSFVSTMPAVQGSCAIGLEPVTNQPRSAMCLWHGVIFAAMSLQDAISWMLLPMYISVFVYVTGDVCEIECSLTLLIVSKGFIYLETYS